MLSVNFDNDCGNPDMATLIYSCRTDDPALVLHDSTEQEMTVLGRKLEIPFTVENMQQAYDNLVENGSVNNPNAKTGGLEEDFIIEASHYYYRFLPMDSLEFETLQQDTVLEVSNIPFEYEIDSMMAFYQAPELVGQTDYTWYYSVLPVDYEFPKQIENEKLNDLYFPPEDAEDSLVDETSLRTARLGNSFYDIWETEALRITENLDEDDLNAISYSSDGRVDYSQPINGRIMGRKWNPSGTIKVEEGVLPSNSSKRYVGVAGAEIKIRKWGFLVIKKARTDRNGYFRAGSTRTKNVKYAIYFNYPYFKVMAGTVFWPAYYRSTTNHKKRAWNRTFREGDGHSHFYSLVQNAAYDYHMSVVPIYSLKRPRYCKISAKYTNCTGAYHRNGLLSLLPVSEIQISRKQPEKCNYRKSDGVYAVTVHELAHASHRELDIGSWSLFGFYNCSKALLRESWAQGVETIVTSDRYWALDSRYKASNGNKNTDSANLNLWNDWQQDQTVSEIDQYTPIVADLYDYINQNTRDGLPGIQPVDRVSGYKLHEIQSALKGCRDVDCWENNLRNKFHKSTEGNLAELFDYVREVRGNLSSPCK